MATAEQGRPSPDIAFLQERGGLTMAHWEEVVRRIGNLRNPIEKKIVTYGQRVIQGNFPDTGNHHRAYLGRRHWGLVSKLNTHDKVQTPRKFPPWPKTESRLNQIVEECVEYAEREKDTWYTLDDHVDYLKQIFERNQQMINQIYDDSNQSKNIDLVDRVEWYQFDPPVGRWRHHDLYERPDAPVRSGGISVDWPIPSTTHIEEVVSELYRIDKNWLIRMWLLTEDDVQDPLHTSPQELESLLRTGVPVEVLNERLRMFLTEEDKGSRRWLQRNTWDFHWNNPSTPIQIGGWEKDIPD